MEPKDLMQIEKMMTRVVGVFTEDIQHKLDLVIEGQQFLGEKVDRLEDRVEKVENRLESVELKVIAVSADLKAHRADTEVHHGVYRVKES